MSLEAQVKITNPTGLHARPAVKLAQLAAGFEADVEVRVGDNGGWVRARSTAKVMKLKAGANATLHFRAVGAEASDALTALVEFVRRDFDEDATAPPDQEATTAAANSQAGTPGTTPSSIVGTVAAEGLAVGRLHVLGQLAHGERRAGTPVEEQTAFEHAVRTAVEQLEALCAGADPTAREILGFQVSMLRDTEFVSPVTEAIAAGTAADQAWIGHVSREVAEYEMSENDYFRGRAADLRDLLARVARVLTGAPDDARALAEQAIVVADELTPSRFLELPGDRVAGLVTRTGGMTSHVAMLARARRLPYMVGLDVDIDRLENGTPAVLDAERGLLRLSPDTAERAEYHARLAARREKAGGERAVLAKPAYTSAGTRVKTYINVDDPRLLRNIEPAYCDGVGLTRTEFLFEGRASLPDEELQYTTYERLLRWADGRPVTIRTLDAGGDKPIAGLTPHGERNPFLGVRGLRLSLAHPEVFRVQLRALARAAVHGALKVMLPMVTLPSELEQARTLLDEELAALECEGVAAARPTLGIMVEVPAAALCIEAFAADFFSIGSNDLTQYVMAAGRDGAGTAKLQDPLHPAVMSLIERVARHGERVGKEVSVCGEMAAIPACIPALIEAGVRAVSVPPAMLAGTKAAVGAV